MKKIFLVLLLLQICSCKFVSATPNIIYVNVSPDGSIIKNIKPIWNGYHFWASSGPFTVCSGVGGGQSFIIKGFGSDFFGPVHIEWENAKGEKVTKDFVITKKDFPGYKNNLSEIVLAFTQADVEYYTSDGSRIGDIRVRKIINQKQRNWVNVWFEDKQKSKCLYDPKEQKRLDDLDKKYPTISTITGRPVDEE